MRLPVVRKAVVNVPELQPLRHAIDGIDEALAGLLAARVVLSRRAQETKARVGLPVLDRERESEIGRRYEHAAQGCASVARAILDWCRYEP